jgi:D-hexose-6-phosphate mutarotase
MSASIFGSELKRLEIPGRVDFETGNGDLSKLDLVTDASEGEIYLHGAHVTGFQRHGEPPLLFTSQFSRFERGQPIRGGVPIIFPWFGARDGEPSHGFARLQEWHLHEATALPPGGLSLRLGLGDNPAAAMWPAFSANYAVTLTDVLRLELIITNTSVSQELAFESCLHTYLHVGDVRSTRISGLRGVTYLDKVDHFTPKVEQEEEIRITGETDRIYLDTESVVEVIDPALQRVIRVEKSGSRSTVLWNPWVAKAQQMPDFGSEEYLQMVCVESGNVGRNRVVLAPGRSTVLAVTLSSHPLR